MRNSPTTALTLVLSLGLAVPLAVSAQTVRRVQVLESKRDVEIEIEASEKIAPQTRVLNMPDRLVIDFPSAVPGTQLRGLAVNRGEVKDIRVGLFQSTPPVTRVVLDLKSPQSFQIFPNGRSVIVKISGAAQPEVSAGVENFPEPHAGLVNTSYSTGAQRIVAQPASSPAPQPALQVTFRDGLLTIRANKASLADLLAAVHQRTGAEVSLVAGVEQEKVVADIGPAPAPEVLASLLNGSKFNFLILSSPQDPRALQRVILTTRVEGGSAPLPPMQTANDSSQQESQPSAPAAVNAASDPNPAPGSQPPDNPPSNTNPD